MELSKNHLDSIKALKSAILQSRYSAATLVNKELLTLYFAVGRFISGKIKEEKWGAKVIENLSSDLQIELPGLRGFSASNIKRMRFFFESWEAQVPIGPTPPDQLHVIDLEVIKFRPTLLDQLEKSFFGLSFSHHLEIIQHTEKLEERIFYIQKTASEFWSLNTLKNHLKNQTFQKTGNLPNNFLRTITNDEVRQKALQSFNDEYLLDFINITDEQPSIGIILCKEKKNKIVEFSFRDFNKAMGVSTYKTTTVLPASYKGILPDVETLKKLMD